MKGNVIGFDPDTNTGAISGHDGNRYDFATVDWRGRSQPRHGDTVDFQAVGQRATDIYTLQAEYVRPGFWAFYFSPSGRISGSQYWLRFFLPYLAIALTLQIIAVVSGEGSGVAIAISILLTIFYLVAWWPSIAILVKRIHDRNKSGWLCLVLYIPLILLTVLMVAWFATVIVAIAAGKEAAVAAIGGLGVAVIVLGVAVLGICLWFFIEFGCLRGTIGDNRFGPDPVTPR